MSPFTLLISLLALTSCIHAAKLNVHIVPHTHDDVGWLKTVDQYFYGANNTIQHAGVQYILDSVIAGLVQNPARRFVYVEQAFFQRWYREQDSSTRAIVKSLVQRGQLEFINGGWCMHDEAATHYIDMVDQTTLGHRFIKDEFGVTPRVGWQIDPFGHSATQAALLSAEVGFDALFFGRIDYQDAQNRFANKNLEFVWRASPSLGAQSQVFTGAFQSGNYGPPDGFCFDQFCNDPPVQDDNRLEDNNVKDRVDAFVAAVNRMQQYNIGNTLMLQMGSDFQYENANTWFKNLDRLIEHVNADGRVNAFYSTPSMYVDAKHAENSTWTVKTDDFFPYADGDHAYWTGYFTSRPALKRNVRVNSAYLQTARQIETFFGGNGNLTDYFSQVQGVAQHHDAVSGTSKQHVAFDYARRLAAGSTIADGLVTTAISTWINTQTPASPYSICWSMNVSVCSITQQNQQFVTTLYNSLARSRVETVSIPISTSTAYVYDNNGVLYPSQVIPLMQNAAKKANAAPYAVVFQAQVPGLGYNTYLVQPNAATAAAAAADVKTSTRHHHHHHHVPQHHVLHAETPSPTADTVIENENLKVTFSGFTGLLSSIYNKHSKIETSITQNFYYYRSWANGGQNSGAYIFRPNENQVQIITTSSTNTVINGAISQEVRQVFNSWITQIVRLNAGAQHVEFEYTVGPIPIDDYYGKEIITRFDTKIVSKQTIYTDSNGREFQQRIFNYRPTWPLQVHEAVAGNYYPMNAAAYIKDDATQLTILNDRSQGVASLLDGQMEIMVHRRTLQDDGRGVGEPIDETEGITCYECGSQRTGAPLVITGTHYLTIDTPSQAASVYRPLQDRIFSQLIPVFTPYSSTPSVWASTHRGTYTYLKTALPFNVEIMTLEARPDGSTLLRLSHQFGVGEHIIGSLPAQVDLSTLFTKSISNIVELSLTANQRLSDVNRLSWNTQSMEDEMPFVKRIPINGTVVTLTPLSIHTFSIFLF